MDVGQETHFHVKATDGVQLECVMSRSTNSGAEVKPVGLLLFHPWTWLGGSMHDAVVHTVWGAALRAGCFNTVLKYNVRGTGTSTGGKSLVNIAADVEDAVTLCNHMLCDLYNPPERIYLVAYSYGSCIASHVVGKCRQVAGVVSIGFPLGLTARLFLRSQPCWDLLLQSHVPKLLVVGSEDQFTSLTHYTKLVADYRKQQAQAQQAQQGEGQHAQQSQGQQAQQAQAQHAQQGQGQQAQQPQAQQAGQQGEAPAGSLDVKVFENCDHFFGGRWTELGQTVVQWVQARERGSSAVQPGAS